MAKAEEVKVEPVETPEPKVTKAVKAKVVSIDGPGVKCDRVSPGSEAEMMLINLASQPKVRTRIPRTASGQAGAYETVILNGLRINILTGEAVDLPEQVSDIIDDAYYTTKRAVEKDALNGDNLPTQLQ